MNVTWSGYNDACCFAEKNPCIYHNAVVFHTFCVRTMHSLVVYGKWLCCLHCYTDAVGYACCFAEKSQRTSQCCYTFHTCSYVLRTVCSFAWSMKQFCCCMKTETIVLSMFGVHVNLKIRTFQWSAVRLGEMALGKGGGERQLLYFMLAAAAACPKHDCSAVR